MFVPLKVKEGIPSRRNPNCIFHVPCKTSKSGFFVMADEAHDFEHPDISMLKLYNTIIGASAMISANCFILYRRRRWPFLCVRENVFNHKDAKAQREKGISSFAFDTSFIHFLCVRPTGKPANYFIRPFAGVVRAQQNTPGFNPGYCPKRQICSVSKSVSARSQLRRDACHMFALISGQNQFLGAGLA